MLNFIAIVNRYEFAQFYRFGYIYIPTAELIPFININSDETKVNLINHFKNKTPFEYDAEYLIIHVYKEIDNKSKTSKFLIHELKSIYPLSTQAKQSIEERIDSRIKLEDPIFESILPSIVLNIQNNEIEMAISALWKIFDLEWSSVDSIKQKIGVEHITKGIEYRKDSFKAFQLNNENIWSILIAYDRYEYFPNSTLGYFFDAGQVFAYSKNANFEKSKIYELLKSLKIDSKSDVIKLELEKSEKSQSYIANTNFNGLKFYIVAPLYLMLKDDFKNCDDLSKSKYFTKDFLIYLKSFEDEFKAAVILLGSFFGYKKIYDLYYDKLNLSFFKSYEALEDIEDTAQNKGLKIQKQPISKTNEKSSKKKAIKLIDDTVKEEPAKKGIENSEDEPNSDILTKEFNLELFILNILKEQDQILVTELAEKIKIERGDKKKIINSELLKEIDQMQTLDVSKKNPKKVQKKITGLFK